MTDTPARLLTLLSLLQTPREWPGSELAERLGVSGRTIRRDIDRLRELGYPVEASKGAVGGYRLVAGAAMPPLVLDDEEAVAIAVGLRAGAGHAIEGVEEASVRALAKLEQVLPSRLRHRVSTLQSATSALSRGDGASIDPHTLTSIAAAATGRERLRFAYEAGDGRSSKRLVEPYRLVSTGRRWYLVAYDLERADWRTFRVDRVREPFGTGARFAARELPMGDALAFVERAMRSGRGQAPYGAEVVFEAPAERVATVVPYWVGTPEPEPGDPGRSRLRFTTSDQPDWVAMRLALAGVPFAVRSPAVLADAAAVLGARLTAAAVAGGADAAPGA
ncbi:YafY family protein [Streptomyces sp. NRRL S-87]|uniref:helix-turn-helix transcriptional regulator n=1 Tax=Streptomyces sp. NRRL S-87 TaxID=1463920 RepID=UPI0004C11099|nr:YafY family protein [Streptomyces sp. NRRL S-87]